MTKRHFLQNRMILIWWALVCPLAPQRQNLLVCSIRAGRGDKSRHLGVPGQSNTRERFTSSCAAGRALQAALATRNV